MKITPKFKNSIYDIYRTYKDSPYEGEEFYRVYRGGEFEVDRLPSENEIGDVMLPNDSLLSVYDEVENNLPSDFDDDEGKEEFYDSVEKNFFLIKGGVVIVN